MENPPGPMESHGLEEEGNRGLVWVRSHSSPGAVPLRHETTTGGCCPIAASDGRLSGVVWVRDRDQLKAVDRGEVTGFYGAQR